MAEAHRLGLSTAAHVHCPASVADAVTAGFDTLEHVSFFTADGVAADPATMDAIVESGAVVSATIGEVPGMGELPPPIARRFGAMIENWVRLHRGGARIVPGTDSRIAPMKPHDVLPYGITALTGLTGLGMTNFEAPRGHIGCCGCLWAHGSQGLADPGADADLLAVTGDPLGDIRALHDVVAVFRAGRRVR